MAIHEASARKVSLEELTPDSPPEVIEGARKLLLEYGRFVIAQQGAAHLCFGSLEKEAAGLPDSYIQQGGGSLIALVDAQPAGFGAWRALPAAVEADSWEMKRLWVAASSRGLGMGRTLTMALIDRARAAGRAAVYLDTAPQSMGFAYRIYLELGFEPCPRYNDNSLDGIVHLRLGL
jgi:GNAT superfamily N-acetyltransferase